MPDYGLLGGLGTGLQAGFNAYIGERKHQEDLKSNNLAKALQAKVSGLQLNATGDGYDETPQSQEDRSFKLQEKQAGLLKTQAETAKLNRHGDEDLDREYKRAQIRKLNADASKEKDPTDPQFNAALFGRRADASDAVIQAIGDYRSTVAGTMDSKAPGFLMSEKAKKIDQSERNFVNSILRRESGAAISSSEFDNAEKQYFPRSGDTPDVIAQKAQNRAQAIIGLKAASGRAWNKVPMADGAIERSAPKAGLVNANVIKGADSPQTKTVDGKSYIKVPGGWQEQ